MKRGFPYELPPGWGPWLANGREIYMDHTHKRTRRNSKPSPQSTGQGVWPLHYDDYITNEELFLAKICIMPKDKRKAPALPHNPQWQ